MQLQHQHFVAQAASEKLQQITALMEGMGEERETDASMPQDEGPALQSPTKCFGSCELLEGEKQKNKKHQSLPDFVGHACNPSVWDAEVRGLQVQGQPVLESEILSQTAKNKRASLHRSDLGRL